MITPRLMQIVQENEGLRLKPYRCSAGKLTIGYGRNLDDVGIDAAEAQALLQADLSRALSVAADVYGPGFYRLAEGRQAALTDMAFNLGKAGLQKFNIKTLPLIRAGRFFDAADALLQNKRYVSQVKDRARRNAAMIRSGELVTS